MLGVGCLPTVAPLSSLSSELRQIKHQTEAPSTSLETKHGRQNSNEVAQEPIKHRRPSLTLRPQPPPLKPLNPRLPPKFHKNRQKEAKSKVISVTESAQDRHRIAFFVRVQAIIAYYLPAKPLGP